MTLHSKNGRGRHAHYGTTHDPKMYKSTYILYIKLMVKTETAKWFSFCSMTLHFKNGRGPYAHVRCDLLPQSEQINVSLGYLTKGKNRISLSALIFALQFYT